MLTTGERNLRRSEKARASLRAFHAAKRIQGLSERQVEVVAAVTAYCACNPLKDGVYLPDLAEFLGNTGVHGSLRQLANCLVVAEWLTSEKSVTDAGRPIKLYRPSYKAWALCYPEKFK